MKVYKTFRNDKVLVDDIDYERILDIGGWYVDGRGYAITDKIIKGKRIIIDMHRFIHPPSKGYIVDHINQNKLDNRRSNLRDATKSLNALNSGMWSHNKSGFKGVSWSKKVKKWRVTLNHMGKQLHLGFYNDVNIASKIYKNKVYEILND